MPVSLMVNPDLLTILKELNIYISEYEDLHFNYDSAYSKLIEHFKTQSLKGFGIQDQQEINAVAQRFPGVNEDLHRIRD